MEEEAQKTPEDQAIDQLIPHIRERLKALFDEGTLRKGDLDLKSIVTLGSLQEPLQIKVMEHMENDRVFLANARSKSGFLIAATDKAKRGELDVRGFGAIDPWKATLEALKCRHYSWAKWRAIESIPEDQFLDEKSGADSICSLVVDVSVQPPESGCTTIDLQMPYTSSIDELKDRVVEAGVFIPKNKMHISDPVTIGVLKASRTLAFYNVSHGSTLKVGVKKRGGAKHKVDAKILEFGG